MTTERWVFTDQELAQKGVGCTAHDEFIATLPEEIGGAEVGVIVYRNGGVSNRFADGTAGVPADQVALYAEVETYYHKDQDTYADNWRDVEVVDGKVRRIIHPKGTTVTEENHAAAFRGRWHFDGQGINRDGEQIVRLPESGLPHTLDTDDGPRRNPERDRIGEAIAAFCQHAKHLEVKDFGEHPPQLFLTVNQGDLSSTGDTVCTVEVKRGDKTARFHLRLYSNDQGKVAAVLTAQKKDTEVVREVTGQFVDWSI